VFVVQLPRSVDRDGVVRELAARGIQSKPYLPAIHLMSYYRERFGHREGEFPVCEDVAARSLALPFFPGMHEGQVTRVAQELVSGEVRVRLQAGAPVVVGRRSDFALYAHALASYGVEDAFPHDAAEGFIKIAAMEVELAAARERKAASVA